MAMRGVKMESNPTHLTFVLSMRSIKNKRNKPIASISLLFNSLGALGGPIYGKYKWIVAAYAQHC